MPDADWWETLWPNPGQVLRQIGIHPDMVAVDLCCGDGLFTAPLAQMTRQVFAIDIDRSMLALARAKLAAVGAENCELIHAEAYTLPRIIRQPVDYVLMANTFHGV